MIKPGSPFVDRGSAPIIASGDLSRILRPRISDALATLNGCRGCVEALNVTRPKLVETAYRRFLAVGAGAIFTNTAGAAPHFLDRYRMYDEAFSVSYLGAHLARAVSGDDTHVIGDVRLPWRLPNLGFIPEVDIEEAARIMVSAQVGGGADAICLETTEHPAHMAAAFAGAKRGMAEAGRRVTLLASVRYELVNGTPETARIANEVDAAGKLASSLGAVAVGLSRRNLAGQRTAYLDRLASRHSLAILLPGDGTLAELRVLIGNPDTANRLVLTGAPAPRAARAMARLVENRIGTSAPIEFANDDQREGRVDRHEGRR
ncbi:MAG: hypothetical protein HOL85_20085 [Rhodospirillaceae bacterium]|nr:hypothetical protein [Rhodospirillaceae bacterium]MBT6137228.1 hypothetical protein [Rhodospirillaceae bacterium]